MMANQKVTNLLQLPYSVWIIVHQYWDRRAANIVKSFKVNNSSSKWVGNVLHTNKFTGETASIIISILKLKQLTSLQLPGIKISDAGFNFVCDYLKTNAKHLNVFRLSHCKIQELGARAIGSMLKVNKTLTVLDLNNVEIKNKGNIPQAFLSAVKNHLGMWRDDKHCCKWCSTEDLPDGALCTHGPLIIEEDHWSCCGLGKDAPCGMCLNKIGGYGAIAVADGLKNNGSLKVLGLRKNKIEDSGALALADQLKTNATLREMDLRSNFITDVGARGLAEALKIHTALTKLDLIDNPIGDVGKSSLGDVLQTNSNIQFLRISSTVFVILKKNELTWRGFRDPMTSRLVQKYTTITSLDVSGNAIGDNGALVVGRLFPTNVAITKLNLSKTQITDVGARSMAEGLKSNVSMKKLIINGVIPVDEFRDARIHELNLSQKNYKDADAIIIAILLMENKSLSKLDLSQNEILDSGACALAEALETNITLTELNLHHNQIADSGARALIEGLKTDTSMIRLDISSNSISNQGAAVIMQMLQENMTLKSFDIRGNTSIGGSVAEDLAISVMKSEIIEIFSDIPVNNLKQNDKSVIELNLTGSGCGDTEACVLAAFLKSNTVLLNLNLSNNEITDTGARALAEGLKENTTLLSLNLDQNHIEESGSCSLGEVLKTNSSICFLKVLTSMMVELKENNLKWRGFKDPMTSHLVIHQNTITSLDLSENALGNQGAVVASRLLKSNATLLELDLSKNQIIDAGAHVLAEGLKSNVALKKLVINGPIPIEEFRDKKTKIMNLSQSNYKDADAVIIASLLTDNKTITQLDLSGNQIGDVGARILSERLQKNSTLSELSLCSNAITDAGANILAQGIETNSNLTALKLYDNPISSVGRLALAKVVTDMELAGTNLTDKEACSLGVFLRTNETLTQLDMSHNQITDEGAKVLAEGLMVNRMLMKLDLDGNPIGEIGIQHLGDALQINTVIQFLRISTDVLIEMNGDAFQWHGFRDPMKSKLIWEMTSIRSLDISENGIGDQVAFAARLLQQNTWTSLDLYNNKITDDGARALARGLKSNTSLTSLDIRANPLIGPSASESLTWYVMHSKSIITFSDIPVRKILQNDVQCTELDLSSTKCGGAEVCILAALIKVNSTLKIIDLSDNKITKFGAMALGNGLKENTTLQTIKINGHIPIHKFQDRNTTALDLRYNVFRDTDAIIIASLLSQTSKQTVSFKPDKLGISYRGTTVTKVVSGSHAEKAGVRIGWRILAVNGKQARDIKNMRQTIKKAKESKKPIEILFGKTNSHGKSRNKAASRNVEGAKPTTSLTVLNLEGNRIAELGAKSLAKSLKSNYTLKRLSLYDNQVSDEGARWLGEGLKSNLTLYDLNLGGNQISDDGIMGLSEGLQMNTGLARLWLHFNHIKDAGMRKLSQALKGNNTLKELYLDNNEIRDEGAGYLAIGLRGNRTIEKVWLLRNCIGSKGRTALLRLHHSAITETDFKQQKDVVNVQP